MRTDEAEIQAAFAHVRAWLAQQEGESHDDSDEERYRSLMVLMMSCASITGELTHTSAGQVLRYVAVRVSSTEGAPHD